MMRGFMEAGMDTGAHLILAGPAHDGVADDPEGGNGPRRRTGKGGGSSGSLSADAVHVALLPMLDLAENSADRQRAPATGRRDRAEEPGGGIRAHGDRSDVEGTNRRGEQGGRHPGSDRGRGRAGSSSIPLISPRSGSHCLGRCRPRRGARSGATRRNVCARGTSHPTTWRPTSRWSAPSWDRADGRSARVRWRAVRLPPAGHVSTPSPARGHPRPREDDAGPW